MHHNKSMYITNVEKEGPFLKIWGQIDKKSSLEVEEALLRASERFDEGKYKIIQNSLEVGILCCAKYVDEKYYRARIASIALLTDGMVEVNFVDYGNKDVIPIGNLRTLECFNPSFISLPPLSSPFILAEVVCIGGEWNDRIVEQISKEIRYMEHKYVIIAQAIRYYFIKVFVHDIDLGLHLVRQNLMQSTSIQTQEAVLLAMIPRTPQPTPPPNQSLLQYKSFTLEPNSQHEVYVSYITDGPCHFSVQLKKYESALAQLMREINSIPLKPLEELPIPGTVCLAKCVEDNHICRAVVTSEVDSQYKLFYVDFGNTELVPPENLYQMAFKFIIPKIMAIRLSLANIEKTSMTLEMQCAFKQFVDNRLLMMEVLPAAKKMALPKCRMWDPDTNTDVIEVLNRAAKCAYPDPIALHKGFTQLVKVSFVYSCNRFYAQLKSKEAELNQLMEELQLYCNSNQTSYLDKAKVGQPCCALFSFDQKWYRSLITEIDGDNVKVRYIDFGNEEFVPVDTLKLVEGEYLTVLRPQAIECCLNGYQNMVEDPERDIKLEELILEQEFTMKVIDTIGSKTLVDLMDTANTTVTALLLESIMAQTKVQMAAPASESSRFESVGKRQGAGDEWRSDDRNSKPYFQHDDRRSPRGQNWKEKTDDSTSWRQNSRKRSDSNSNESTESWRQDNRGFKNRRENDWNDRPSNNNVFKNDKGFRSRPDNAENERPQGHSNRFSEGNYWNNRKGFRNQSGEGSGVKEDGWNQNKPSRNQNESWGGAKEEGWNQNKSSRNTNGEWGDSNPRGDRPWKDNNQGFKKKYDRENKDWGKNENGDFKRRNKPENTDWNNKADRSEWNNKTEKGDWNNKTEKGDWNNKTEKGDWNNKTEKGDWNNKTEKGDWNNKAEKSDWKNKTDKSDWNNKPEKSEWNNKTSGGAGGDWGEKKQYKDRNTNRDDWNANKGGSERKFGDRRRDNDRGDFKKKPFRRETNELSSSESEKSFGKGLRTSSRNDNRPPRSDRKFGNKSSDNSWNVSAVASVIDSAPNDAKFKSIDVSGRREKVAISWFHNPCSFFCQLVDSQEPFKKMMEDIQLAYKGRPAGSCVKGAPAVGLFPEDNVLYRARIVDLMGDRYKIHYVDFGNVSVVDKVWPIENKFMEMPMQAIPCGLAGLEPLEGNWPNPDNYSAYFEREGLDCSFLSCDESGRYWVNLTADKEDVTQQLVDNALAKYSESIDGNVDVGLLVGQQFRAMLQQFNGPANFTMLLQSGIILDCSLHNLATATEINEDLLKQQLGQILIVFADNLMENRLEVTLYDSTGTKLNVIDPDEGAFDTVDVLCPHLVVSSTLSGFVSHVDDASVVVQPAGCAQNVEYVLEQMYEYYENMPPPDAPLVPEEESVYAVKSDDGNWYRGRVTAFDDDRATVTYVDYGNSERVEFSRLREVAPEMLMWDAMAVLVKVKVPTADFADQDVIATIYNGETGWEGEVQLAETSEQPPPPQGQAEPEIASESSSVQFTETLSAEITQDATETTLLQSDEILLVRHESSSSGVENENVVPAGGTPVVLSHVDSPSDFYIQLLDSLSAIDELQLRLQDMVGEMTQLESGSVGGLCAAPYSIDQQWYRSQILDADDDITTVRFIDYGNTDVIDNNATQIKTLPAELLALEEYATRCRLKIKPTEEDWSKAAVDRFEQLTTFEKVTVEFVDQDEKTNYVELYSDGANVKDLLIGENLALLDDVVLEGKLTGFVSHMNSPSEFWVQLESCCAELEWIAEQLSNAASFRDMEDLTPGSLCAAMFPDDEMWYRARILSNTVAGLEVLFLDYGNSCVCSNLKQLPEHLVMAPPLAQKCSLQRPEGVTSWSAEAAQKFSELSADGQTIFTVKKLTTGETSIVELLANGEEVSSKLIVDNGYVTDVDSTQNSTKETAEGQDREEKPSNDVAALEIASDLASDNEEEIVTEIALEKKISESEENKVIETNVIDIEQKTDDPKEESKKKLDDSLENIPAVDSKEEPLNKLEEANDKGKAHPDVEYLSHNTVRLYLDENNMNNELKELLSPILKEKTARPVSVIATIEVVPESIRREDEMPAENSGEIVPCRSANTSLDSSGLESDTSKSTTVDSQDLEVESVADTSHDNAVRMVESLVDNIVSDVYSGRSPELKKGESSFSNENNLDLDEFPRCTNIPSEETEDCQSSEQAISNYEFGTVPSEEVFPLDFSEQPIRGIASSVMVLALEAPEQPHHEAQIDELGTVPGEEVLAFEHTERSICKVSETTENITEPQMCDTKTENEADCSPIVKNEIYDLKSPKISSPIRSESLVMGTDIAIHEISDDMTEPDTHNFSMIQDIEEDTLKQTTNNFEMTGGEIRINSNQLEKTIETEADAHNAATQLETNNVTFNISNILSKEDIHDCEIEYQTETIDKGPEMPNVNSTEQRIYDIVNTTKFDANKLEKNEGTDNKDDINAPNVIEQSEVDIEKDKTDITFSSHQQIGTGVIFCKENLRSLSMNPEIELIESKSTNENKNYLNEQVSEVSPETENNNPITDVIVFEGILKDMEQPIIEKQNFQDKDVNRVSLEVACEYLELHKMDEMSTKPEREQIQLGKSEKDDHSISPSEEQITESNGSNIVLKVSDVTVLGSVAGESEENHGVCSGLKPSDNSQQKSSVNLKLKHKNDLKVEFQEKILTSFSAPIISECTEPATKLSPTKIVPKSRTDSIEKLGEVVCEEKDA